MFKRLPAVAVVLFAMFGGGNFAASSPNIVLIMCDDLGWGDVGFNGGTTIKTPHLDVMARSSLKFNRFYAQAPVCSPTRGSCLTGRHPYRYGIYHANVGHITPREKTLAELLRDHGYTTGHFGKWHLGTLTTSTRDSNRGGPRGAAHYSPPQSNGFDVCFSTEAKVPTYDPMLKPIGGNPGHAWDAIVDRTQAEPYGTYYWNQDGKQITSSLDGDDSQVIMDRAIPFVESAVKQNQPFLAVIWFHTPHLPVVASPAHRQMYAHVEGVLHRNYYGCVTAMDEQVGRLRKRLNQLGVADETMICFCSDNGPEGRSDAPGSAGPFRGRKRSLYEGGIRVPSLIEWTGHVRAGGETDFPAVTSDYVPTILDAVGIAPIDDRPTDGLSLLPVFDGRLDQRPQPIGFQHRAIGSQHGDRVALSDNRYKLIGNATRSKWELYDLTRDQGETMNLAAEHPQIVESMARRLKMWRESCAADHDE